MSCFLSLESFKWLLLYSHANASRNLCHYKMFTLVLHKTIAVSSDSNYIKHFICYFLRNINNCQFCWGYSERRWYVTKTIADIELDKTNHTIAVENKVSFISKTLWQNWVAELYYQDKAKRHPESFQYIKRIKTWQCILQVIPSMWYSLFHFKTWENRKKLINKLTRHKNTTFDYLFSPNSIIWVFY